MFHRKRHQSPHFIGVGRREDRHAGQRPEDGQVIDRFVRRTQGRIYQPAATGDQADVGIVQTKVQSHLLKATPREERGDGVDVNDSSFQRETRCDADDVGLADAFHEEAVGHLRFELLERADAQVGTDENDPLVLAGKFIHHIERSLAHQCPSNSASNDLTSSGVTLFLWCQFRLFSTKLTPFPLMV